MKQKSTILRLILIGVTIVLIASIYMLSRQPASQSSELSMRLAVYTLPYAEKWTSDELSLAQWNHMLRKTAHFTLFFMLSSFIMLIAKLNRLSWFRSMLIALSLSVTYAIIDESHQWFVDGRGASVRDVVLDSGGAILGIAVVYLVGRRWLR